MYCAYFINLHQRTDGNCSPQVLRPSLVWFLKVWISLYVSLTRWLCGSTSRMRIFLSSRYFFTDFDATLLMMLRNVLKPFLVRCVMFSFNVSADE